MKPISNTCHGFPPQVLRQAVWLPLRFTLSLRDVEELWRNAAWKSCMRRSGGREVRDGLRPQPSPAATPTSRYLAPRRMVNSIGGRRMCLCRAVDSEGEVLDLRVRLRRNEAAALKLLRTLLKM